MAVEYQGPWGLQFLVNALGSDLFNRVVHFELYGRTFTDATVDELCKLKSLRSVSLRDTNITDDGLNRLRQTFPNGQFAQYCCQQEPANVVQLGEAVRAQLRSLAHARTIPALE